MDHEGRIRYTIGDPLALHRSCCPSHDRHCRILNSSYGKQSSFLGRKRTYRRCTSGRTVNPHCFMPTSVSYYLMILWLATTPSPIPCIPKIHTFVMVVDASSPWRSSTTSASSPSSANPPPTDGYYYPDNDDGDASELYSRQYPNGMNQQQRPPAPPLYTSDGPPRPPGGPPGYPSSVQQQYGAPIETTAQQQYNPIHYEFPSRTIAGGRDQTNMKKAKKNGLEGDDDTIPVTYQEEELRVPSKEDDAKVGFSSASRLSARRDAVTIYMSTRKGKATLRASATIVGAGFGAFVGKSIFSQPRPFALTMAIVFFLTSYTRGAYGEWVRALGLMLIYTLQRSRRVRKMYPTYRHLRSSFGIARRQRFPPSPNDNPWSYRPGRDGNGDLEFNMTYCVIAMAFVGSACGGNMPLIPSWMGALGGGALFAYIATLSNPRGDLARSMGMRCVAIIRELLDINTELQILQKSAVVSGKILDKALILDRKHRIKDRIVSGLSFLYDQGIRAANQVQSSRSNVDAVPERRGVRYEDRRDDIDDYRKREDRRTGRSTPVSRDDEYSMPQRPDSDRRPPYDRDYDNRSDDRGRYGRPPREIRGRGRGGP